MWGAGKSAADENEASQPSSPATLAWLGALTRGPEPAASGRFQRQARSGRGHHGFSRIDRDAVKQHAAGDARFAASHSRRGCPQAVGHESHGHWFIGQQVNLEDLAIAASRLALAASTAP
jgi:hypothetical protein